MAGDADGALSTDELELANQRRLGVRLLDADGGAIVGQRRRGFRRVGEERGVERLTIARRPRRRRAEHHHNARRQRRRVDVELGNGRPQAAGQLDQSCAALAIAVGVIALERAAALVALGRKGGQACLLRRQRRFEAAELVGGRRGQLESRGLGSRQLRCRASEERAHQRAQAR